MSGSVRMRAVEQRFCMGIRHNEKKTMSRASPKIILRIYNRLRKGDVRLPTGMYTVIRMSVHFSRTPWAHHHEIDDSLGA